MFKKEDIVPGMLVYAYIKNKDIYNMYYVTRSEKGLIAINKEGNYFSLDEINDDFISTTNRVKIMRVYGLSYHNYTALSFDPYDSDRELLWERKNEVDWENIPKDTKVQIKFDKDNKYAKWYNRYFYKYENSKCYVYPNGSDSFTYDDTTMIAIEIDDVDRIKLYEGDDLDER